MLLIPAIDLKEGRCVRLKQGRMADADVFSDDPVAMALHWMRLGCQRLHIVDLDGAFAGEPRNRDLIAAMVAAVDGIPVQIGGGIRSLEVAAAYLEAGAASVIVGTRAVEEPRFLEQLCAAHPGRVMLGLDARSGVVATAGWDVASGRNLLDLARAAGRLALEAIVYTDIDRDGMLTGVDLEATLEVARASNRPVIASGGVADLDDVRRLKEVARAQPGLLLGAITGRALYAGTLDLVAANRLHAA
jgi:phosphoribosylformimino-5-aminoimidazole carboxamide ribotide isomerase